MTATHAHATHGSALREARALSGQGLCFALDREVRELAAQLGQASGGRVAKTLAKTGTLRVTLVHLAAGTTVDPEASTGEASVQVLSGQIELNAEGRILELGAGQLVVLGRNLREPLRARQPSTLMITVAWREGAGAWDQETRDGQH
jgi:quercetin dioxygenase-like cupin family protein